MNNTEKLFELSNSLNEYSKTDIAELDKATAIIDIIGEAWSGSWLGYHAYVYYEDFKTPPTGAHFSQEWGFDETFTDHTRGNWKEYSEKQIFEYIYSQINLKAIEYLEKVKSEIREKIEDIKETVISYSQLDDFIKDDNYLKKLLKEIEELKILSVSDCISYWRPQGQLATRDSRAIEKGQIITPPHIMIKARISSIIFTIDRCNWLQKKLNRLASHNDLVNKKTKKSQLIGTSIFIGHGGSSLWRELKDFISERLHLPYEEFNRIPVAGVTNVARLSEMLSSSAFAFLIMTAEDERVDGKLNARLNVIHEVGLFQGRLGFDRAIILLEEGCEEFSNIQGLGQIRFPKGKISACFEEVRRVLERSDIIDQKDP